MCSAVVVTLADDHEHGAGQSVGTGIAKINVHRRLRSHFERVPLLDVIRPISSILNWWILSVVAQQTAMSLEPIDPETALDRYLTDRETEVSQTTLYSHSSHLSHFLHWCE